MAKVKYIIPEDGDEMNHPNVFTIPKSNPTLGELRKLFPPSGTYHFRFLKAIGDQKVWLDATNESDLVPFYEGQIFAKVTRLLVVSNVNSAVQRVAANTTVKSSSDGGSQKPAQSTNLPIKPTKVQPKSDVQLLDSDFGTSSATVPESNPNLFGNDLFDVNSLPPSSKPQQGGGGGSLLDVDSSPIKPVTGNISSSSNLDLFGLDTLQPTTTTATNPSIPHSNSSTGINQMPNIQLQRPATGSTPTATTNTMNNTFNHMNLSSGSLNSMSNNNRPLNSNSGSSGNTATGGSTTTTIPLRGQIHTSQGSGGSSNITTPSYDAFSGLGSIPPSNKK